MRTDIHRLAGVAERFLLEVRDFPRTLDERERALAERAARALRFGLEERQSGLAPLVDALARALFLTPALSSRQPPEASEGAGALLTLDRSLADLAGQIADELLRGRIGVVLEEDQPLTERREGPVPELPPRPPPRKERPETFFEVRFVDEIGQGIPGLATEFAGGGGIHPVTTNAAGVALLEGVEFMSATITAPEPEALDDILSQRWTKLRPGKPPKTGNLQEFVFEGDELAAVGVKPAVPNTVVLKPPLARLHVQLFDKTGRVEHAESDYTISGPQSFEGTTDEAGFLLHEDVFPGDYTLTLSVTFEDDGEEQTDQYDVPLVALPAELAENQLREVGVVPFSVLARLHFSFNTNKALLLPTAMPAIEKLRGIYADNAPCELLVVGHADTAGGAAYNDALALARAKAVVAYLKDDVDAWLAFYDGGDPKQRWGKVEDHLMLIAMPDFASKTKGEDAVRWFQRTRGLTVDGKAGPQTRRLLITEYMELDGTSLAELHGEIIATAHGCGENFPLDESGEAIDEEPADGQHDRDDRRVELFFFEPEFGINPTPPSETSAAGSTEYPAWRATVIEEVRLEAGDPDLPEVLFAEIADAHFRTNSAVVLPEGENPDAEEHQSLTSVGVFATVLRFNDEDPGRSVLVAGPADTTATVDFNQKLSEERAGVALALLKGDRDAFVKLCDARHTVADIKQILSWASTAFAGLTFDCDPGAINDNAGTLPTPVRGFQTSFNANKSKIGSSAANLTVDGSVGPLTWGAFFDCYELALRQELGENQQTLADLRKKLVFADAAHESLGFSEHFPIDELGVDNFRSQANRRVEIVLFPRGQEPDLAQAADDPETSELYLPGYYERIPLPRPKSARRQDISFKLVDHLGLPLRNTLLTLQVSDGDPRIISTDGDGAFAGKVPPGLTSITLDDGRLIDFSGGYSFYKHDPVKELAELTTDADVLPISSETLETTLEELNSFADSPDFDGIVLLPE